ncbi:MAG: BamA/TamA family outer membrane protein [bacterium]|nr:BamA/TamA family outer membrane protein [bacterium]
MRIIRFNIIILAACLALSGCAKKAQTGLKEPVEETGPRLKLGQVTFTGNTIFSQGQLTGKMTSQRGQRFDDFTFQQDRRKIIYMYQKKGYLEAKFENTTMKVNQETQELDYILAINEGQLSAIGQIQFQGNELYSDSVLLSLLKVKGGDALNLAAVKQTSSGIVALYAEKGYLYASVKDTIIKTEDAHVSNIVYRINEGSPVYIGLIRISGNKGVSQKVIKREMNLASGSLLMPSRVYHNQQRVYALGLFTEVRFEMEGLADKSDTVNLLLFVKEDNNNWYGFNFGYQQPDRLQLGLEWGSDNIFGNLQKITLKTDIGYGLQNKDGLHPYTNNYFLDYLEPYFLSLPLRASGSIYYKKQRDEASYWSPLSRLGGEAKVGKSLTRLIQVYLGYKYEFLEETNNTTSDVFVSTTADKRDDIFNPTRGYNLSARLDQAGSVLGGSNDYRKSTGEAAFFHHLGRSFILAWHAKASGIYTFNRVGPVPIQERLKLGGAMNLRGYSQDEISADTFSTVNMLVNGNLELRIPVYKMLGACLFVDAGNVWADFESVKWKHYHGGTGLGFRFYTPIGPVRLDYAVKTEGKMEVNGGLIYINLGHAF